ncbi:MAG: DUF3108 domain-containing protein [Burkholderiales bacterium]|nr:DUF3108 domain-containing protein [Burkholderiales bacterium]
MTRSHRTLALAVSASVALHVAALGGWPALDRVPEPARTPPLQAQLVAARPVPVPARLVDSPRPVAPTGTVRAEPRRTAGRAAPSPVAEPERRIVAVAEAAPSPVDGVAGGSGIDGAGSAAGAASDDEAALVADVEQARTEAESADFGPPAAYPIRSLEAVYDLFYGDASPDAPVGRVTHTWSSDGRQYVAESVAEGSGLVSLFYSGKFAQRSEGQIGAGGLVPEVYTLRRGRADATDVARFDWRSATVALESKGETRVAAIAPGTQDPLSAQHQFYFVQPLGASGQFRVADGRKLRAFWYEVVGEELVETALGVVSAIHMRRANRDDATADVWVDPHRSYLPVKIRATDRKGRVVVQQIRSLDVEPLATAARSGSAR